MRVIIAEKTEPTAVRRTVSFSEAVYEEAAHVEGVEARLARDVNRANAVLASGMVAVVMDPQLHLSASLGRDILVDAMIAKRNQGTNRELAPGTIALGPGFTAGVDVDAVVETNRGPDLGRVIWSGSAQENTHEPASVAGHSADRVLRAPASGALQTFWEIGAIVDRGDRIAQVAGVPVLSPFQGVIRGLLRPGAKVKRGLKIGDLDPRLDPGLCHRISDKALAVAGGVLEATLVLLLTHGWRLNRAGSRTIS